jgi:hypothetical protein
MAIIQELTAQDITIQSDRSKICALEPVCFSARPALATNKVEIFCNLTTVIKQRRHQLI